MISIRHALYRLLHVHSYLEAQDSHGFWYSTCVRCGEVKFIPIKLPDGTVVGSAEAAWAWLEDNFQTVMAGEGISTERPFSSSIEIPKTPLVRKRRGRGENS